MPTLIITRGLPGAGKTTLARAWVAEDPQGRARCNRDDLRDMFHGGRLGRGFQEEQVSLAQHAAIRRLLHRGVSVVCDDTNLAESTVKRLQRIADECDAEFEVWDLRHVPLEVCIAQDAGRTGADRVGADAIQIIRERHSAAFQAAS